MEIVKITKKKLNTYEILLSDKTKLNLYDDTIIKFSLLTNKKLNQEQIKEVSLYNSSIEAYYKALKYLSVKLRTKGEVNKKLKTLGYDAKVINDTIKRLDKEGYLNEDVYIKAYITDQINLTLNGPKKIANELNKLGLNSEKITNYLASFEDNIWQDKITKIIEKKIKANHNLSNLMLKQKIKKDLLNLGYSNSLVNNILNDYEFSEDTGVLKKELDKEYRKLARKYKDTELYNKLKYNLYKKGFSMDAISRCLENERRE